MKIFLLASTAWLALSSEGMRAQDHASSGGEDRIAYVASGNQTGATVPIPIADLTRLCADMDGCTVRIGMDDWDAGAGGRVASRELLFFYDPRNGNWRASFGDSAGSDNNGRVDHVSASWTCF